MRSSLHFALIAAVVAAIVGCDVAHGQCDDCVQVSPSAPVAAAPVIVESFTAAPLPSSYGSSGSYASASPTYSRTYQAASPQSFGSSGASASKTTSYRKTYQWIREPRTGLFGRTRYVPRRKAVYVPQATVQQAPRPRLVYAVSTQPRPVISGSASSKPPALSVNEKAVADFRRLLRLDRELATSVVDAALTELERLASPPLSVPSPPVDPVKTSRRDTGATTVRSAPTVPASLFGAPEPPPLLLASQ